MKTTLVLLAVLTLGCPKRQPPPPGPPPAPALLPVPPEAAVDPLPSLEREVARLADVAARLERVHAELSRVEPRADALRSIAAVSASRHDVLRALALAVADGPKGLRLTEITGHGSFWAVTGVVAESELLTELVRLLRRSLHLLRMELPKPPPGVTNWEFTISFQFPEPGAPPGGPPEASAPELTSAREKRLRLAIAELQTRADTAALFEAEGRLAELTREVAELDGRHLRPDSAEDAELESYTLTTQADLAGLKSAAVQGGAVGMWLGLRARTFHIASVGPLGAASELARAVVKTGAFVGSVTATLVPGKALFAVTMDVHVALR